MIHSERRKSAGACFRVRDKEKRERITIKALTTLIFDKRARQSQSFQHDVQYIARTSGTHTLVVVGTVLLLDILLYEC